MASVAVLEALLARVQKRANEPRPSSVAVLPILEAVSRGTNGAHHDAVDVNGVLRPSDIVARDVMDRNVAPVDEVDDDIEEYDDELIEIIDDAEVIPEAAAVARAIEPGAFGAAVDGRNASAARPEPAVAPPELAVAPVPGRAQAPVSERSRAEVVAPRPIAATEVASTRGARRELRRASFIELLDATLKLG